MSSPTTRLSPEMLAILRYLLKANAAFVSRTGQATNQSLVKLAESGYVGLVPWKPDHFLGENPTASKRAAISERLKKLEARGLVRRCADRMKLLKVSRNERTRYVVLTKAGRDLALLSILTDDERDTAKQQDRQETLKLQIKFLWSVAEMQKEGKPLEFLANGLEQVARTLEELQPYVK